MFKKFSTKINSFYLIFNLNLLNRYLLDSFQFLFFKFI